jgi:hypothetical protein
VKQGSRPDWSDGSAGSLGGQVSLGDNMILMTLEGGRRGRRTQKRFAAGRLRDLRLAGRAIGNLESESAIYPFSGFSSVAFDMHLANLANLISLSPYHVVFSCLLCIDVVIRGLV